MGIKKMGPGEETEYGNRIGHGDMGTGLEI